MKRTGNTIPNPRPRCPRCESGSVYVRADGTLVCRRCGYDEIKDIIPDDA